MTIGQRGQSESKRGSWYKPFLGTLACVGIVVYFVEVWRGLPQTALGTALGTILFGLLNIPMFSSFAIIGFALTLFEIQGNVLFRVMFQVVKPFAQLAAIVLYIVAFFVAIFSGIIIALGLSFFINFLLSYFHILPQLNSTTLIYFVVTTTSIFLLLWHQYIVRWLLSEWRRQRDFGRLWLGKLMPWIDHERMLQFLKPEFMNTVVYACMFIATVIDILERLQGMTILGYSWWIAYKEVALFVLVTVIGFDNLRDKGITALREIREVSTVGRTST